VYSGDFIRLDSELSATFSAAALKYESASFWRYTCAEPVSLCTVTCVWLVSSLWHIKNVLYTLSPLLSISPWIFV